MSDRQERTDSPTNKPRYPGAGSDPVKPAPENKPQKPAEEKGD